jgi:hypothetical protein
MKQVLWQVLLGLATLLTVGSGMCGIFGLALTLPVFDWSSLLFVSALTAAGLIPGLLLRLLAKHKLRNGKTDRDH